jgi:hypothetical protein
MKNKPGAYSKVFLYTYIVAFAVILLVVFLLNQSPTPNKESSSYVNFSLIIIIDSALIAVSPTLLFMSFFKKVLWYRKPFKFIFTTPYIDGRWQGIITSSYDKHEKESKVYVEFHQSLDNVILWYFCPTATAHSIASHISIDEAGGPTRLLFIYEYIPSEINATWRVRHIGAIEMFVYADSKRIKGSYFNHRRENSHYGKIELSFLSRDKTNAYEL